MNESLLESNLINALGRLKSLAFDNEFLSNKDDIALESVPEQYFSFYIGEHNFVVHASFFCAVFIETPIAAVPNSVISLVGLSNIRGALTPIYQLHSALGYLQPKKHFVFCVGKADKAVGLLVDALPISLALTAREKLTNENSFENPALKLLIKHSYFSQGKRWHLVEGERFGELLLAIANLDKKQIFQASAHALKKVAATI